MGMPAATLTSPHICPKVNPGPVPHVGGPVITGSGNVFIGGMPAARKGDKVVCVGPPDTIAEGSSTVFINGKPAARMGDSTEHGGKIVGGVPTVIIGNGTYVYEEDEGIVVTNKKSLDGGSDIFSAPKSIEYNPTSSVVLQPKGKPLCGPTTCNMVVNDAHGNAVDLTKVVNKFPEIRKCGVNINEMSDVLKGFDVTNTPTTSFSGQKLLSAAKNNQPVIVGVPAGSGNHFLIVDGIKTVDGVPYYLTRDPLVGPRGVRSDILTNAVNINKNAILVGE